jgi:Family of unknown function (DUF5343)
MPAKGKKTTSQPKRAAGAATVPKFPYTTKPSSLRRLLQDIPKKPKPPKFDGGLLKSWGFPDNNDYTMLRVLKAVGLLNVNSEPTDLYTQYMRIGVGPAVLAEPIKKIYEPLFNASHAPYKEPTEQLQNLFNIHSGGGASALDAQIQTFKALCENTSFDALSPVPSAALSAASSVPGGPRAAPASAIVGSPVVNINLHIHLPENKTRRDYEAIIEDIGRYIFGRTDTGHGDE